MATPVDVTPSSPRELVIRRVLRATPSAVRRGWTDADTAAHEAMGFHAGWGVCADPLEALAASLPGGAA